MVYKILDIKTQQTTFSSDVEYIKSLRNVEVRNGDRFSSKNDELSNLNGCPGHCLNYCLSNGCEIVNAEVAQDILVKAKYGEYKAIMLREEIAFVVNVWNTLPGHTSFYDALCFIAQGRNSN